MEMVRKGRKHDIDNPDLSERSIPEMTAIQDHPEWNRNTKMLCAYLYNTPPVHPRRTLDQFYYHMLEDTKERDQDQVISRYYHNVWKRSHQAPVDEEEYMFAMRGNEKPEFHFQLSNVDNEAPFEDEDVSEDFRDEGDLLRPSTAKSARSALDGYAQGEHADPKEPKHVMMVDQLWLWILDDSQYTPM